MVGDAILNTLPKHLDDRDYATFMHLREDIFFVYLQKSTYEKHSASEHWEKMANVRRKQKMFRRKDTLWGNFEW